MNNVKTQIKLLKEEIKKWGDTRKTQKHAFRKNQSNYDKIVGQISWISPQYKERKKEYKKVEIEIEGPIVSSDYITALHIVYNRLRNKPSHLQNEEKENAYTWSIKECMAWLEEEEKVSESSEIGVGEEVENAS